MCVYSITARHGANKSSLQEGGPLIYQTAVTSQVILLDRSHLEVHLEVTCVIYVTKKVHKVSTPITIFAS